MEYSLNNTLYNRSSDFNHNYKNVYLANAVYAWIIFSIEIPLIFSAIYAVFFLTKSCQGAPVFVINLLITDLIQIFSFFLLFAFDFIMADFVLIIALYIGMYFMTCVAVERYLLIAHPVWYRSHRSVKHLVCTSLIGWCLTLIIVPIDLFYTKYLCIISPFIYYTVIIFCCAGAYRALSHSQSVTSLKRQLVLASLFFVLLSFTFTIIPLFIIEVLFRFTAFSLFELHKYIFCLNAVNPIVDCVLYVFLRNDVGNAVRTPHCCSRPRRIQSEIPLTNVTDVQRRRV